MSTSTIIIIVLTMFFVLLFSFIIVCYKYYKLKENDDKQLEKRQKEIEKKLIKFKNLKLVEIEEEFAKKNDDEIKKIIRNIVIDATQQIHLDITNDTALSYINVSKKDILPKFIGKKGQNLSELKKVTHCNINVSDTSEYIEVSCLNPFDKAICINTINHLIKSDAFDINAINNVYKKEKNKLIDECKLIGKQYLKNLNIEAKDKRIYEYVGRLKYRFSYGQNMLQHCWETSIICEQIAKKINLNSELAKKIGFFHDIGKSCDYQKNTTNRDHISVGVEIAKQCELGDDVINAIAKSHHHKDISINAYESLVIFADAISAGRKCVRHEPKNDFNIVKKFIEEKLNNIDGINQYVIEEINELEIMIFFRCLENGYYIKQEIFRKIKQDPRLKKYKIKVNF